MRHFCRLCQWPWWLSFSQNSLGSAIFRAFRTGITLDGSLTKLTDAPLPDHFKSARSIRPHQHAIRHQTNWLERIHLSVNTARTGEQAWCLPGVFQVGEQAEVQAAAKHFPHMVIIKTVRTGKAGQPPAIAKLIFGVSPRRKSGKPPMNFQSAITADETQTKPNN